MVSLRLMFATFIAAALAATIFAHFAPAPPRCVFDHYLPAPQGWWFEFYKCPDGTWRRNMVAGQRG